MTNLFVVTRGGIGDHLISSGIINHLSETNFVNLACWKDWVPTLESLYCENPNIKIHPVQDYLLGPFHDRDMKKQAEKFESKFIGLGLHTTDMKNYYRIPYIEQKLPFEYMYSKFKLPSKIDYDEAFLEIMKPKNPYVLLNIWDKLGKRNLPNFQLEHVTQGLETVYITPGKTKNLLNWIPIILDAEEIHSIPGGPCHLIDLTCTGKLFYHDARMGTVYNFNNEYNNNKWHVIKYREKIIQ